MASFYKAHPHRPYSEIGPKDKFDFYMLPLACMTYNGGLSPPPMAAVQLWTHPLEFCRSLDDIIPCCFLVLFVQSGMFRPYIQKKNFFAACLLSLKGVHPIFSLKSSSLVICLDPDCACSVIKVRMGTNAEKFHGICSNKI